MLTANFFIQARLSSTRLPCKVGLLVPGGNSCLKTLVLRLNQFLESREIDGKIYVACPLKDIHCINLLLEGTGVTAFGGDEENVAKRFYDLALYHSVNDFIRITGDNPFVCYDVLDFIMHTPYQSGKKCISLYNQKLLPNGTVVSKMSIDYLQSILVGKCTIAKEHLVVTQNERVQKLIQNPDIPENMTWPCGRFCLDNNDDYIYFSENPMIYKYNTVERIKKYLSHREVNKSYWNTHTKNLELQYYPKND